MPMATIQAKLKNMPCTQTEPNANYRYAHAERTYNPIFCCKKDINHTPNFYNNRQKENKGFL